MGGVRAASHRLGEGVYVCEVKLLGRYLGLTKFFVSGDSRQERPRMCRLKRFRLPKWALNVVSNAILIMESRWSKRGDMPVCRAVQFRD